MTRSLYLVGGAGTGKSTFMAQLLSVAGLHLRPQLEDLHATRNAKNIVTLRGHRTTDGRGLYLGVMRKAFPGSDGLDRASSPTGEAWLLQGDLPQFILGEGATLATRRFLGALADTTTLVVVHLRASDEEKLRRFGERGSDQASTFVTGTATRMANLADWCAARGVHVFTVDTEYPEAWNMALDISQAFLAAGLAHSPDVE